MSLSNPASMDRAATKEKAITTQEIARNGDESIRHLLDDYFQWQVSATFVLESLSASEVVWGGEEQTEYRRKGKC